jgi:hypothetical protein
VSTPRDPARSTDRALVRQWLDNAADRMQRNPGLFPAAALHRVLDALMVIDFGDREPAAPAGAEPQGDAA